jgi:hypothetical protein
MSILKYVSKKLDRAYRTVWDKFRDRTWSPDKDMRWRVIVDHLAEYEIPLERISEKMNTLSIPKYVRRLPRGFSFDTGEVDDDLVMSVTSEIYRIERELGLETRKAKKRLSKEGITLGEGIHLNPSQVRELITEGVAKTIYDRWFRQW